MNESKQTTLKVSGMTCISCVRHVAEALGEVEGVIDVQVSGHQGRAVVKHEGDSSIAAMVEALREAGYEGTPA